MKEQWLDEEPYFSSGDDLSNLISGFFVTGSNSPMADWLPRPFHDGLLYKPVKFHQGVGM